MPAPPKRSILAILLTTALFFLLYLSLGPSTTTTTPTLQSPTLGLQSSNPTTPNLHGHAIASKLSNATKKAELGNHAWYLFHTTFASFPDSPSADESAALKAYIHLFQRLYPCGECAEHFGAVLERFPPQVASRSSAAAWGCHVHNEVNRSLGKAVWDCGDIGEFYDCGCAEEEEVVKGEGDGELKDRDGDRVEGVREMSEEAKDKMTGARGRDFNVDLLKDGRREFEGLGVKGGRKVFEGLKIKGGRKKFEGLKDKSGGDERA